MFGNCQMRDFAGFPPRIKYGVTFFRGNDGWGRDCRAALAMTVWWERRMVNPEHPLRRC